MDDTDDLYAILGLPGPHVGAADVKAAYRKMSMLYHPDRNGGDPAAGPRFAKVNQAYEVLGNPETRAKYDAGRIGPDGQERAGPSIPEEVLAAMFGGAMGAGGPAIDPFGMGGVRVFHMGGMGPGAMGGMGVGAGGSFPSPSQDDRASASHGFSFPGHSTPTVPDLGETVTISLEKAYTGCTVPVSLRRSIVHGRAEREERETLYVNVPAGVDDEEIIRVPEQGHVVDGRKGDIKVFVKIRNTTSFQRDGLDLVYKCSLPLRDALAAPSLDLHHLDGRTLRMKGSGTVVSPGTRRTLRGLGMKRDGRKGNLVIEYDVRFPNNLTKEQVAGIQALL